MRSGGGGDMAPWVTYTYLRGVSKIWRGVGAKQLQLMLTN